MLNKVISFLRDNKIKMVSMSEVEVKQLENYYHLQFPQVYRDFLIAMGKGAGRFMKGSSIFFDEIYDLSDGAKDLILENNLQELPNNAFVFWMHQGYQMAYFLIDGDKNPDVYFFSESFDENHFIIKDKLSSFFEKQLVLSFDNR